MQYGIQAWGCMKKEVKETLETEVIEEPDFLVKVCPIDPKELADCEVCQ